MPNSRRRRGCTRMAEKYSLEWCREAATALESSMEKVGATELDLILCGALAIAETSDQTAAEILRELADLLDADDLRTDGGLH